MGTLTYKLEVVKVCELFRAYSNRHFIRGTRPCGRVRKGYLGRFLKKKKKATRKHIQLKATAAVR